MHLCLNRKNNTISTEKNLKYDLKKKMKIFENFKKFLVEFCAETSIHGIRYFTEQRRHRLERGWWAIAVALAFWFCGTTINGIWSEWRDHPVNMIMAEKMPSISEIPFPTVTICPKIKAQKKKFNLYTHYDSLELYRTDRTELFRSLSPKE